MTPAEAQAAISAGLAGRLMRDGLDPCLEVGNAGRIDILSPASEGSEGGDAPAPDFFAYLTRSTKGRCTFLQDRRCAVHDTGFKPIECRLTYGCEVEGQNRPVSRHDIARLWMTAAGVRAMAAWRAAVGNSEPTPVAGWTISMAPPDLSF